MQSEFSGYYDKHVFCCQNVREPKDARGCCSAKGAVELREYMKDRCKELALKDGRFKKIRINASGCLDRCELGPTMVIYPEGIWYHYQTKADVDNIIESHLLNDVPVERLMLKPGQKRL